MGNMSVQQSQRDIRYYLIHRYNWILPHQFNGWLTPVKVDKKLNVVSGIS